MAGLAQYSEYFENPLFTETVQDIPVDESYISGRFLPRSETFDLDWNETVLERQADMANIVDTGAELPLTDRDPVRRVSGEIADIGQSYIISKKELRGLMSNNEAERGLMEIQLLNKAARVSGNIDARIEWMNWQAIGNGILTYSKSNVRLGIDFGIPADHKKAAATKWDGVTPTILVDYEGWVQDYVDANGEIPDVFVTSIKAIRTVLNDATVREQVGGASGRLLTLNELNDFLRGRELPPMEAFDSKVTYRDVNDGGTRVTQRLLPEYRGVFLLEGGEIGDSLLGPTIENEMNPGIFGRSFTMERPKREIVEVVAASMPKVTNPELILYADILTQ